MRKSSELPMYSCRVRWEAAGTTPLRRRPHDFDSFEARCAFKHCWFFSSKDRIGDNMRHLLLFFGCRGIVCPIGLAFGISWMLEN